MKNNTRSGSRLVRLKINVAEDLEAEDLRHHDGRKYSMSDKVQTMHESYRRWAMKGILNIEMRPAIALVRDHLGESGATVLSQIASALERASKFKDPHQREKFLEGMEQIATKLASRALEVRIEDEGILRQMEELSGTDVLDDELRPIIINKEQQSLSPEQ